jgi:hypothetical protein
MQTNRTILIVTVMPVAAFLFAMTFANLAAAQQTDSDSQPVIAPSVPPTPSATEVAAAELAKMTSALSDLMASKDKLAAKKDELTSQIDDLNKKATDIQTAVAALESQRLQKEAETKASAEQIKKLKDEKEELDEQLRSVQVQIAAMQDENRQLAELEAGTYVEYSCGDGVKHRGELKVVAELLGAECNFIVHLYSGQAYKPSKFIIRNVKEGENEFELPIGVDCPTQITVDSRDWYIAKRYSSAGKYKVIVEYAYESENSRGTTYKHPVDLMAFRLQFNRWAFQFTAKVFTAWRLNETDGDTSFLLPGIAAGPALRFRKLEDPGDVLALRLILALGPNLLSKSSTEDTDAKTKFQVIGGFELSILRYVSVGCAWIFLGSKTDGALSSGRDNFSGTPLLLITYGDLYPALASTK